jgi:hypothetical protein
VYVGLFPFRGHGSSSTPVIKGEMTQGRDESDRTSKERDSRRNHVDYMYEELIKYICNGWLRVFLTDRRKMTI